MLVFCLKANQEKPTSISPFFWVISKNAFPVQEQSTPVFSAVITFTLLFWWILSLKWNSLNCLISFNPCVGFNPLALSETITISNEEQIIRVSLQRTTTKKTSQLNGQLHGQWTLTRFFPSLIFCYSLRFDTFFEKTILDQRPGWSCLELKYRCFSTKNNKPGTVLLQQMKLCSLEKKISRTVSLLFYSSLGFLSRLNYKG